MFIKEEESVEVRLQFDRQGTPQDVSRRESTRYPSTRHSAEASERLSSYRTRSPPIRLTPDRRFSPYGRSPSREYFPATPIRSPSPLREAVNWAAVIAHRERSSESTIADPSHSGTTRVESIGAALRRAFLPLEVEQIIREGLELGVRQREQQDRLPQIIEQVHRARDRIQERLFGPERLTPGPDHRRPRPFVQRRWSRGPLPPPLLRYRIGTLRPPRALRLPTRYAKDYDRH